MRKNDERDRSPLTRIHFCVAFAHFLYSAMSLPNHVLDDEYIQKYFDRVMGYTPTHDNKYIEWESIRSQAQDLLVRIDECLLRVEEYKRRMGPRFGDGPYGRLGHPLFIVTIIANSFRNHLAEEPDFTEAGDAARAKLGGNLRMDLGLANVDLLIEMLDAPLSSILDRLRVVRYDVRRALSSFAQRCVLGARNNVVPFDGVS